LAVATALREQHKGKVIVIARDDDHRLETNPGRTKALEAAAIERASVARELQEGEKRDRSDKRGK
jgi:phage/plasmid primase-like uncharacterized protein